MNVEGEKGVVVGSIGCSYITSKKSRHRECDMLSEVLLHSLDRPATQRSPTAQTTKTRELRESNKRGGGGGLDDDNEYDKNKNAAFPPSSSARLPSLILSLSLSLSLCLLYQRATTITITHGWSKTNNHKTQCTEREEDRGETRSINRRCGQIQLTATHTHISLMCRVCVVIMASR